MRIVITSNGAALDAPVSPIFGRCPVYIFADTETGQWEAVDNPARGASGGAGIQAAQFVIERGAQAVVTGQTGPNAAGVFQATGLPVYSFSAGTVEDAITAFKAGGLALAQSGGRGGERGRGAAVGAGPGGAVSPRPAESAAVSTEETIAGLKETVDALRRQLAELTEQIDRLPKE